MTNRAVVVGAGGAVGESAALHLRARGWHVRATMRRWRDDVAGRLTQAGCDVVALDLDQPFRAENFAGFDAAVLTPILSVSVRAAQAVAEAGLRRVIAFSSNNVALDADAPTYRKLAQAEDTLRAALPNAIVLRPTLIYGDPRLATVPRLMRWARRFPVLPVPGSGRALQQPVFHDDLGRIAAELAASDAHASATFALGGPDVVTMRAFFEAIVAASGSRAVVMPTPRVALEAGRAVFGARFPFDAAQIARVELDRVAAEQIALPAVLAPRVALREGLGKLAAALAS